MPLQSACIAILGSVKYLNKSEINITIKMARKNNGINMNLLSVIRQTQTTIKTTIITIIIKSCKEISLVANV